MQSNLLPPQIQQIAADKRDQDDVGVELIMGRGNQKLLQRTEKDDKHSRTEQGEQGSSFYHVIIHTGYVVL
jgi:hypothetical protein